MTTKITDANIDSNTQDNNAFNISLLGFKMAVNEGLTVFNLVDGVVDEFNDESGTDEAEGSNDLYCGTSDYYINSNTPDAISVAGACYSAGFSTSAVTEPDTSTAQTGAFCGSTAGTFTVPCGATSINTYLWGAGGSGLDSCEAAIGGGGGGFATGTLAVTPGQTIQVVVAEGGIQRATPQIDRKPAFFGGGGGEGMNNCSGYGGGLSALLSQTSGFTDNTDGTPSNLPAPGLTPYVYMVAGGGGGGGGHIPAAPGDFSNPSPTGDGTRFGGAGGGLIGFTGGNLAAQSTAIDYNDGPQYSPLPISGGWPQERGHFLGGGGSQIAGGQPGNNCFQSGPQHGGGFTGQFFEGGGVYGHNQPNKCHPLGTGPGDHNMGSGGAGFFGGGAGGFSNCGFCHSGNRSGGGGSSYYGNPQVTCGATTAGNVCEGGGISSPFYVAGTNEGYVGLPAPSGPADVSMGEDGYILITSSVAPICATAQNTTIVSSTFTSTSVATSSRIVVFEENVDTPTLNTDIIASISRDGGTTFTNATLSDSGYVTGSSGQRILTGQADISGQPSGQSMRWKLALANNQVKIHGVSLQWS